MLGSGQISFLSNKLIKYLSDLDFYKKRLLAKYHNDVLLVDSVFESGNILHVEMINNSEY